MDNNDKWLIKINNLKAIKLGLSEKSYKVLKIIYS